MSINIKNKMTSYTLTCCVIIHHSRSIQIGFAISNYIISLLKEDCNLYIEKKYKKAQSKNKKGRKMLLFENYISKSKNNIKKGLEIPNSFILLMLYHYYLI